MRIKIELYSDKKQKLDLNYYYYLSSYIYSNLKKSDEDYSEMLHDKGYSFHNKSFKLFTFSSLIPQKFVREGSSMVLDGKIIWYVSSPVKDFIMNFAESVVSEGIMRIANCELAIKSISVMEPVQYERKMSFISLSPIVVTTGKEVDGRIKPVSVSVDDPKFIENIKNNAIKKYFVLNGLVPENLNFNITFKNVEKYSKGKLIKFKNTYLKGYQLPFDFEGSTELIETVYETGIGEDNSSGMGFIERCDCVKRN